MFESALKCFGVLEKLTAFAGADFVSVLYLSLQRRPNDWGAKTVPKLSPVLAKRSHERSSDLSTVIECIPGLRTFRLRLLVLQGSLRQDERLSHYTHYAENL